MLFHDKGTGALYVVAVLYAYLCPGLSAWNHATGMKDLASEHGQVSQWQTAKKYHLRAKRLITKNRKWNIIFHIEGVYVVVDAIIPSSLMK